MARDLRGQVTCHAGFSGCDYPLTVQWDGTWLNVTRIIHEWRQPGSKSWQVGTAEGKELMLSYDESDQRWMVIELVH